MGCSVVAPKQDKVIFLHQKIRISSGAKKKSFLVNIAGGYFQG
jgi:hypothetical protein